MTGCFPYLDLNNGQRKVELFSLNFNSSRIAAKGMPDIDTIATNCFIYETFKYGVPERNRKIGHLCPIWIGDRLNSLI